MSVSPEEQGLLQGIYTVGIPGDSEELTWRRKYTGSWQST